MDRKCYIGVDLGGTKISAALFLGNGSLISDKKELIEARKGVEVADLMCDVIQHLIKEAQSISLNPISVGICVPGIAYHNSGQVWAPNISGWDNFPLRRHLSAVLPEGCSISIDSDRACYILGETWQGAAKGCNNALFVAVGTGIGLGILMDGHILRGHGDVAGASGWMALMKPYLDKYDSCGCFEYYASGDGIARTADEVINMTPGYHGPLNKEALRSEDVFCEWKNNDPIAVKTLKIAVEFWGMATANYISLFNPEKIIFGGGVFGPAACLLPEIKKEACKWAQPIAMQQVELLKSTLDSKAGLIGAGRLAILQERKG